MSEGGEAAPGTPPAGEGQGDGQGEPAPTDWQAEFEKLQRNSRKWEERAKANADAVKELDRLRQDSMSDLEKAVAIAKAEARSEALTEVGSRLVAAEVRAAAAGRSVDVDALLEGVDPRRFLTDDGEPDGAAIQAWVDRIAPPPDPDAKPGFPNLGQGSRGAGNRNVPLNGDPIEKMLRDKLGIR